MRESNSHGGMRTMENLRSLRDSEDFGGSLRPMNKSESEGFGEI